MPVGKYLNERPSQKPGLGRPVREHFMRQVDELRGGEPSQHLSFHDADERVAQAEVGRQGDHAGRLERWLEDRWVTRAPRCTKLRCVMPYLYLVRHGQPDFTGNYDSLTALGMQQSNWLGEHFAARGLQFARVASGTLAAAGGTRAT